MGVRYPRGYAVNRTRGRGGTGRRAGFRSRWASALGGSIPLARTAGLACRDVAPRDLFAVAMAGLCLGGCGGSGAPLEAVELAVPEGMDRPPFDVARRIVVP